MREQLKEKCDMDSLLTCFQFVIIIIFTAADVTNFFCLITVSVFQSKTKRRKANEQGNNFNKTNVFSQSQSFVYKLTKHSQKEANIVTKQEFHMQI